MYNKGKPSYLIDYQGILIILPNAYMVSKIISGIMENIPISKIFPNQKSYSFRRLTFDEDEANLANSIRDKGLLYPLIVRICGDNYELLAGRRRLNACKMIGYKKVFCNVIEASDKESFEISLIENIHVKRIDPLEEAEAFKKYVFDYGWGGISELANKINKSVSYVNKRIRLLDLPSNAISYIDEGSISPSIAEELLIIKDKQQQSKLADLIHEKQLSKKITREIVTESRNAMWSLDAFHSNNNNANLDNRIIRSYDQSIVALKMAMNKISDIIDANEDNWVIYERLMYQKTLLSQQIDQLIKDKKKNLKFSPARKLAVTT